ncbi:MAG TPA: SDR family oxidoreductase [Frankiaceae bacterium]|jgi:NAD(P)-dependent dehydrogenase (short-subunit alcohol dehydrogenase family)|nr:SDR family oxidoreductase [Frankiaceae bacterium]
MSGLCDGRVVVVTGAGGGIGRSHALLFAQEGAKLVVNDIGGSRDGSGSGDAGPAQQVVNEIKALGGEAIAHTEDISTWDGAKSLIQLAIDTFGSVDVVVNNAGILRDRMMVNMTEAEWDAVIKVHLKGTFGPAHFAAEYWRDKSKAGEQVDARIINTTSPSGIFGNVGQSNYGAAKAGIAAFTVITSQELGRYGVTVNAIAPTALTRMTEDLGMMAGLTDEQREALGPDSISPIVVWLGSKESAGVTGRVFGIFGPKISVAEGWAYGPSHDSGQILSAGELGEVIPGLVEQAANNASMLGTRD